MATKRDRVLIVVTRPRSPTVRQKCTAPHKGDESKVNKPKGTAGVLLLLLSSSSPGLPILLKSSYKVHPSNIKTKQKSKFKIQHFKTDYILFNKLSFLRRAFFCGFISNYLTDINEKKIIISKINMVNTVRLNDRELLVSHASLGR